MKKLLLLGAICSLAQFSFSQSIIHNKLTLEVGTSLDGFAVRDIIVDELFAAYEGRDYESHWDKRNNQVFDFRIAAQYRIARKISVEFGTSSSTYEERYNEIIYNSFTDNYDKTEFDFGLDKRSFTLGFNYFIGNSYAPLGMHIGLFYSTNRYTTKNSEELYAFLQRDQTPNFSEEHSPSFVVRHLGLKIGSVSAISKKIPLFFKYGATFALPINSFVQDKNHRDEKFSAYSTGVNNHNDVDVFDRLVFTEYARLYLGFGYMF